MPRSRLPILQAKDRPGILDLGLGHPNPSLLPVPSWVTATQAMSASFGWQALTYGYTAGPGPLIEWLAEHLAGIEHGATETSQFFVTAGASHALALLAGSLTDPGDVVLVDSPTYHYALRILLDQRVELARAPTDDEGIDTAALEESLARLRSQGRRVPMLYIVPTFGNPTGRSLPAQRRRDLVRLAQRTGLLIVEDDTYRELCYEGAAPPSLWRLAEGAGGAGVARIGSFAKTVAPGLRLGWINAEPGIVRKLMNLGYVDSGGGVNHATALTMATFGTSGAYDEHLARLRPAYRSRRDTLVKLLRGALPGFDVPSPAGGWFVWLRLPEPMTASALLRAAEPRGVSFVEGARFYPDGQSDGEHIRLCFSFLETRELAEATGRLASAVSAHPGSFGKKDL